MTLNDQLEELAKNYRNMSASRKLAIIDGLPAGARELLATEWRFLARPEQYRPSCDDWFIWLYLGGLGSGKTWTGANFIVDLVMRGYRRPMLVGRTAADIRDTMIRGPSGLIATCERLGIAYDYKPSVRRFDFIDYDCYAILYSAEEPDQFRGPEHDCAWADELCAWNKEESWDLLLTRLRHGDNPRLFVSTTPQVTTPLLSILRDAKNGSIEGNTFVSRGDEVIDVEANCWVTTGSTFRNKGHLAPQLLDMLKSKYEGTRFEQQELYGQLLLEVDGALWTYDQLQELRSQPPPREKFSKVVLAVDPAVTTGESSDETGIVVVGKDLDGGLWVLADYSVRKGFDKCLPQIDRAYQEWKPDLLVAETNQGGDLVKNTLIAGGQLPPYKAVRATKGKYVRAEPVAMKYDQNKVKHAYGLDKLEAQMITFTPDMKVSPDRVDALVWGMTELVLSIDTLWI